MTGLCMTPEPRHCREDTNEDKDKYCWRGFQRQIPSRPAAPPTSGNSATGSKKSRQQAGDGSQADISNPFYDAIVEEIERVIVAEGDFEGTREEYDREKDWLINTTYFCRIFEYTEKHPGATHEDMLREMIEEEEKEDDVKSSRLAEDEKMGIERVNLFMEQTSTEPNIQPCTSTEQNI